MMGSLVLIAMLALAFTYGNGERRLNERLSFSKKDKIPYGVYVAYQNLVHLYPEAIITNNTLSPEKWDSASQASSGQTLIIISPQFLASENEMNQLIVFAQQGNDVFISARILSYEVQDMFHCRTPYNELAFFASDVSNEEDTLAVALNNPPFSYKNDFSYPGKRFESHFYKYDTLVTRNLGTNKEGFVNFIQLKTGSGNIFLHLAPMVFTNYFLLHKDNDAYYDEALSVISKDSKKIIWDEYFRRKLFDRSYHTSNKGWLTVLFKSPPFKWGLLAAIFTLALYVLLESRRKQRYIPEVAKPRNDSLDFVKTIGRLYYEKNDHRDLARKMGLYFLEQVRNKYKLSTSQLDNEFIKMLHFKSGYPENELRNITSFIHFAETAPKISDVQLANFHKQLEEFYMKT
ncbi:MAG: hypothetical protein JWM28_115 [Chitinophagaceae bacterium]|nr:hypothetical protein [Chitinophagaceae bacterium]